MPKILITGNGFDLNYGLPTLYSDFIKVLSTLGEGQQTFESIYSKTSNFKKINETFKVFDFDKNKILILKTEIDKNLWFNFFKNELNIETWIDFEKKIEYVLKNILLSFKILEENIFSKGSLIPNKTRQFKATLNKNSEIIGILKFFNIIIRHDTNNYYLNVDFLVNKYQHYIGIDKKKISDLLNRELVNFNNIFTLYIETFVYPLYDNLKIKVDTTFFSSIDSHYTFNYTPTFNKFFNNSEITKFLHGKIDLNFNNIVLGINEIPNEDSLNQDFISFTKYFQKLNNNTDYSFIHEFKDEWSSKYLFFFFGHSLNNSDKDYINEVFEFINKIKATTKKIIIIYHNETSKSNLLINLLKIRGKDNIVELMKDEKLLFHSIDSQELKHELNRDISLTSMDIGIF
jgi:hypothetical protein